MTTAVSSAEGLTGRRALVTGAARGIGQATALALARAGAGVVAWDVLDTRETVAEIERAGGTASGATVDVGARAEVHRAMSEVASRGGLDVLVCAAGVYGRTTSIENLDEAEVDEVFRVNLKGQLWCIQAALPLLRVRQGTIVSFGSVAGKVGGVLAGPHYVASKGAVHGLVRWVAKAVAADGVRCNGIAPGAVATEMTRGKGYTDDYCPLGRLGQPQDLAEAALYLASPASNYVTGTVLDVNGGYYFGG